MLLLLVSATAFADPQPQAPPQGAPPQQVPRPQIASAGVVGQWVFTDGACTTSTNWTFRRNGTGEAQQIEFRYARDQGARYRLVWTSAQITQDYDLVVDGDRMTSFLRGGEPRVCHWKRVV